MWPIVQSRKRRTSAATITPVDVDVLMNLYRSLAIPRERLPYTKQMGELARSFSKHVGFEVDEAETWRHLIGRLKQGGGKLGG